MAKRTIKGNLSVSGIQKMIDEVNAYRDELLSKNELFKERLERIGLETIQTTMESVPDEERGSYYTEIINNSSGEIAGAAIHLSGTQVLFIEFSAGITHGTDSYPLPSGSKYGMGTYPGQGHWDDPKGWWYIDERGEKHHSYGNRAYMPMYHAEQSIILAVRQIAKEVFGS